MYYSVWVTIANRWTTADYARIGRPQDQNKPFLLCKDEAEQWLCDLKNKGFDLFEVRGIGPNNEGIVLPLTNSSVKTMGVPVNDYTCPICKNNRCSKSEDKCWLCGNQL